MAFGLLLRLRITEPRLWLIGTIVLLNQFSISVLNDWADADLDAAAHRARPIPLRLVKRQTAFSVALGLGALSLLISLLAGFGWLAFLLLLTGLLCGWLYDLRLKPTPLSFLPFAVAFPLLVVWIAIIARRPSASLPIMVLGAVPLAIAIHLADSIPDREADAAAGLRTLAVALGRPFAEIVAVACVILGSSVAGYTMTRHGAFPLALLALLGFALTYLSLTLGQGGGPLQRRRLAMAKWTLIGASVFAALLVVRDA